MTRGRLERPAQFTIEQNAVSVIIDADARLDLTEIWRSNVAYKMVAIVPHVFVILENDIGLPGASDVHNALASGRYRQYASLRVKWLFLVDDPAAGCAWCDARRTLHAKHRC